MNLFMRVSQAVRDTLMVFVSMALVVLIHVGLWLVDEQTARKLKERHNG